MTPRLEFSDYVQELRNRTVTSGFNLQNNGCQLFPPIDLVRKKINRDFFLCPHIKIVLIFL